VTSGTALLERPAGAVARRGGTLRLYGNGDVDQLDPAVADASAADLLRLLSRQLVTYEARQDLRDWQAGVPVPDVAIHVPSTYNMGLGASQRGYVLHLRPDVYWDTTPERPVTAHDFVRGFKRMCNPLSRPRALTYFTSSIRGMADFCAGFEAAISPASATADALAAYQDAHEIPGVFAVDDETLVIEVVRPALDFVHMLALPCASAAPVEYEAFLPGSRELQLNLRSNGPYRVAHYVPGRELVLERNPAWRRGADPVRRAYVESVEVTAARTSRGRIEASIDAGDADLAWGPESPRVPLDAQAPGSYALDPYLVFNVATGSAALKDVRVRRAIAAAIDKSALAEVARRAGDLDACTAATIVPPNNDAHHELSAAAPDPALARALLAEAGYADGLTLVAAHGEHDLDAELARSWAADLERVGIGARLVRQGRHGLGWDVATRTWSADWTSLNGRVFLQPLFQTGASANDGGYSSALVDALVDRALSAAIEEPRYAAAAWRDVEREVLADVAVVPLLHRAPGVSRRSERVRNALALPAHRYAYDLSAVWLEAS
jgi:peptide/nickel transport system substrate-binding protein